MDETMLVVYKESDYSVACPQRFGNSCALASMLAGSPITTTPEICRACSRTKHPKDTNEVVLAMAGIGESNKGPGTTLKKLLSWFVEQPADCQCPNRVRIMDAWGPDKCLENLPTILNWLRDSAHRKGIRYSEYVISTTVKLICYGHKVKEKISRS
jgi:hypothetical protein